jgi:hypothetical protein
VKGFFVGLTVFAAMNSAVARRQLPRITRERAIEAQKPAVSVMIAGRALRRLPSLVPESVAQCRRSRGR